MSKYYLGVDLGASLIKFMLMGEDGVPGPVRRLPTCGEKGPDAVLKQLGEAIGLAKEELSGEESLEGIGLGTPGLIGAGGEIIGEAVNIPGWRDVNLKEIIELEAELPVIVQNDVNLTALGEYVYYAEEGVRNLVCISIGTGIGGGFVINDELYTGSHGLAAEIGHIIVEPEGIECNCGQRGCLEAYASANGILFNCKRLAVKFPSALAELCTGNAEWVTAELVYTYARQGDKLALEVHDLAGRMLARAIGQVMNLLAPDVIVLCGGVMNSADMILPAVLEALPQYSIDVIRERCSVVPGTLGQNAGVTGAALYALQEFGIPKQEEEQ